ncbi:hypothetical protein NPIL_254461 [Nephila pilipes]|uniref:Uncharacterized protein n=1 Tax=Nephila pilipes TaxID=299642 RepID=A0A8X6UM10_NEPPI|nr:hypothetical protein NPIL_254461 [Nephila pilipes]
MLHKNARLHIAIRVRSPLLQRCVIVIAHPPFLPELVPAEFFMLPRLKEVLKYTRFADLRHIRRHVICLFHSISKKGLHWLVPTALLTMSKVHCGQRILL